MCEISEPKPSRSWPIPLQLIVVGVTGTLAYGALAPFAGFGTGMGPVFLMLVVMAATWLMICSLISGVTARSTAAKVGIFAIGFVVTFIYFQIELRALAYAVEHVLPRPVFHNRFVHHELAVLPFWYPPFPICDEFGQCIQADHELNLLAVALAGSAEYKPHAAIQGTTRGFTVEVNKTVEFEKIGYALVVVLPSGTSKAFHLKRGLAKQFEENAEQHRHDLNFLRQSRELLSLQDQSAFDAFTATYSEPIPPRPVFHYEHVADKPPTAPYWRLTEPRSDKHWNRGWADFIANFVVIVMESAREQSDPTYRVDSVWYYFSTYKNITVPCEKNTLVVVARDLTTSKCAIPSGFAEKFYRADSADDLLETAARLLPESAQAQLKASATPPSAASSRPW